MGQVSTEQAVRIIEAVGEATQKSQPNTNYWWLFIIAIIPVIVGYWLKRKKNG